MNLYPIADTRSSGAWELPSRGHVAMLSLIIAESAIFMIFLIAYIFYLGKSLNGPTPVQVLEVPWLSSICLVSSSITIWRSERAIERVDVVRFKGWLLATIILGTTFLVGTATEWRKLLYEYGLTIRTNLFGTTFYSLVGLHAAHVIIGLLMLTAVLTFSLADKLREEHADKIKTLALYWHFVDGVWVVVFTTVYLLGR